MIIGCLGKLWITPFIIILSGNPTDCDDITGAEAFEAAGVAKCSVATSKEPAIIFTTLTLIFPKLSRKYFLTLRSSLPELRLPPGNPNSFENSVSFGSRYSITV
jgi:hypothetical protein